MKKKELIIVLVLAVIATGLYGFNYFKNLNAAYVNVTDMSTGKVVDKISLNKDGYYTYKGLYGNFNIEVKNKTARAVNVDCPNHDCEKMGSISPDSHGFFGIICVPNGFEVSLDE